MALRATLAKAGNTGVNRSALSVMVLYSEKALPPSHQENSSPTTSACAADRVARFRLKLSAPAFLKASSRRLRGAHSRAFSSAAPMLRICMCSHRILPQQDVAPQQYVIWGRLSLHQVSSLHAKVGRKEDYRNCVLLRKAATGVLFANERFRQFSNLEVQRRQKTTTTELHPA
jgi:hypothetical protein